MKILLLGHRGYLGSYLHKNLLHTHDVEPKQKNYDYIINCIGKPSLEYCEENPEVSKVSNYIVIIPYLKRYTGCKVINFSSYYVYDDTLFCTENANTTKDYFYTAHNLLCEELITKYNGVTFRLGKLFGNIDYRDRGKLTEYIIKENEMVLDLVRFNPTSVMQVKEVVEFELKNNYMTGVYNLSNDSYTTHYNYGMFINTLLRENKNIKKIEKMQRSFHNYDKCMMSVDKLKNDIILTHWMVDLKQYLRELQCTV